MKLSDPQPLLRWIKRRSLSELLLVGLLWFTVPAYMTEKGKNLATREDIGEITKIVEQIRVQNQGELERLKAGLADVSEAQSRRRNIYERLSGSLRIFIQGQFAAPKVALDRRQDFLDSYAASWLWASDDLIRSLNTFILLNLRIPAEDDPKQRQLKSAYFEVLLRMRKEAGFSDTQLRFEDLVFVQF
ncbi:MAG: hypothetical protein ABL996_07825 [Micropepsaceae bacterium]